MHVTDRSKTVVMLIDWDNLQICHSRDAPGTDLDLQALIALAQSYGTLVTARAYAEWNLLSERLAVYRAGIEPVFAPVMRPENSPREGKSLADTVMVADGVDLLWTVAPDVFVLATSDKDMIPLARIAKQRGAAVVVLGSDLTAIPLVEMSNVFITYRQLLRELDRVGELEAPVGRAPARERRLRESRRPSSEPYGSVAGAPTSAHNFSGASNFGGALGLGSGGRSGGRGAGTLPSTVGPSLGPSAPLPPRRPQPTAPVAEIASTLAVTPVPSTIAPREDEDTDGPESGTITLGEPGARRRRRRGGRGRRTGIGSGGDGESLSSTSSVQDDGSESESEEPAAEARSATVIPPSPDDLDDAVLKLLAARDRESGSSEAVSSASGASAPSAIETAFAPSPEPTAVEPSPAPFAAPPSFDVTDEPLPPPRKRMARTSFGAFGPRDSSVRPLAPVVSDEIPAPPEPETLPAPEASAPSPEVAEVATTAPAEESAVAATADSGVESVATEAVADDVIAAVEESTEAATSDPAARSRSGRSGRSSSGRRVRRPAPAKTGESGALPVGEASGASAEGEPAAPPRRRRTRQAVREAAATTGESSAAAPSGEASA